MKFSSVFLLKEKNYENNTGDENQRKVIKMYRGKKNDQLQLALKKKPIL